MKKHAKEIVILIAFGIFVVSVIYMNTSEYKFATNPLYCEKDEDCRFGRNCERSCTLPVENVYQPYEECTSIPRSACRWLPIEYRAECVNNTCTVVAYDLPCSSPDECAALDVI